MNLSEIFRQAKYESLVSKLVNYWRNNRNNSSSYVSYGSTIRNCSFDQNVFVGHSCNLNRVNVGKRSYFNRDVKIVNASIGSFCSIGSEVQIGFGEHPVDMVSNHPAFYSNNKAFETFADDMYFNEYPGIVTIGHDVWIGSKALIMNNIEIGTGAIIAAGSIVTKNVKAYSIVGGIPAKLIRMKFSEDEIEELLSSEWWTWSAERLKEEFRSFHKIEEFISELKS